MKAAYYLGDRTIDVRSSEVQSPGPDEVRINVAYCGVCGTDLHIFQGHMDKRVKMPAVVGHEMSGEIAEIGENVTAWKPGDRVVVRPLDPCGRCPACQAGHSHICYNLKFLGIDTPGAFQGSWTVPAHTLHRVPYGLPLDQAALTEPVAVACHDVRLGGVKAGDQVVVIGGGPIGTLVALVAQNAGAKVLLSEVSSFRQEFARELGLEAVNPMEVDLVALVEDRTGGAGADVAFEVSGSRAGAAVIPSLVRTRGQIVVVAIFSEPPEMDLFRFFWRELKLRGARVYEREDFDKAIELVASGALPLERLITARWPIEQLQQAFETLESSSDQMKVLIDTRGE